MTLLNILNFVTVACGLTATISAYKIYRLTRSSAVLWLVASLTYITVARLLISIAQAHPATSDLRALDKGSSYIIFLFWPVLAVAMVMLYCSLKSIVPPKEK